MTQRPSDPALLAPLQQLEAVEDALGELLTSCSQQAFGEEPEPGHWSPAQCLEHLIQTTKLYLAKIDPVIEDGHRRGLRGRGEGIGWFEEWFIGALEPPPKRRFKAPAKFQPRLQPQGGSDPREALQRFRHSQAELVERIIRADGLPVSRLKIASPVSPLIRFRLVAAFQVLATHQRRHLWQLRRILALGETMI